MRMGQKLESESSRCLPVFKKDSWECMVELIEASDKKHEVTTI